MTCRDRDMGIRTATIEAEIQEAGEVSMIVRIINEMVNRGIGESVQSGRDDGYAVKRVSGS